MKKRTRLRVVPAQKGWIIVQGGQTRPLAGVDTKERALKIARTLAKRTRGEVYVHGKDGRIQSSYSVSDVNQLTGAGRTLRRDARTGSFTTPRSAERIRSTSLRAADVLRRLAKR